MAVYKKKVNGVWQTVSTTWPVQIGAGGSGGEGQANDYDGWKRPSEWPDLESLPAQTGYTVYISCDRNIRDTVTIDGRYIGSNIYYTIDRVRINSGTVTVLENIATNIRTSQTIQMLEANGRYQCFRITSAQPMDKLGCPNRYQAVVESYIFNATKYLGNSFNNGYWGGEFLQHTKIINCSPLSLQYVAVGQSLELIEFSGCDFQYVTNTNNFLSAYSKLRKISFKNCVNGDRLLGLPQNMYFLQDIELDGVTFKSLPQFNNYSAIKHIDLSTLAGLAITSANNIFGYCYSLESIDFSGVDMGEVTSSTNFFNGEFEYLKDIITDANTVMPAASFKLGNANNSPNITHTSLMNVINALPTVTNKTLTIGATNIAKLSAAEIAIATGKGWTLA